MSDRPRASRFAAHSTSPSHAPGRRHVSRAAVVVFAGLVVAPLVASTEVAAQSAPPRPSAKAPKAAAKAGKKKASSFPYAKLSEKDANAVLRAIEGRLSVGETVDDEDRKALSTLLVRHPSARVRALATSVLPWLGPDVVGKALLRTLVDPDPMVRVQGANGMSALSSRFEERHAKIRDAAIAASTELLDDEADDVACAASDLLRRLAPTVAQQETRARIETVKSDVRFACWRAIAQVPPRQIRVPPPVPPSPPKDEPKDEPEDGDEPTDEDTPPAATETEPEAVPDGFIRGDGIFIATWASAGLMMGAVAPFAFSPPRDVLTYSRNRTRHAREEPSIYTAAAGAIIGAGALGAGAWALTEFVGPLEFGAASAVTLGATSASVLALGGAMAFGLDETGLGIALLSSNAVLLSATTALAYFLPPSSSDIAMAGSVAGLAAIAGGLTTFVATPVGVETLFDDVDGLNPVPRTDFGLGVGLMTGAVATIVALGASPLLDVEPARMAVTAGGGVAGASIGMLGAYLFTPTGVDIRPRIAAGVGLVGEVAGAALAFFLVPDAWLGIVEVADPNANGAVVFDGGKLKLGVPQVVGIAPAGIRTTSALAVPLVGGTF